MGAGTKSTLLGMQKFVTFIDVIHNDIFQCIVYRTASLTRLPLTNTVIKIDI